MHFHRLHSTLIIFHHCVNVLLVKSGFLHNQPVHKTGKKKFILKTSKDIYHKLEVRDEKTDDSDEKNIRTSTKRLTFVMWYMLTGISPAFTFSPTSVNLA